MRGTPCLLAAAALLQAACAAGGERELQGSTVIYCYLLSTAIYSPQLSTTRERGTGMPPSPPPPPPPCHCRRAAAAAAACAPPAGEG